MSKEAIINEVCSRFKSRITQTYKRIKDDPKYHTEEMPVIRPKDVDYWFKHSHLTLKPKYHYESQFNSFVAPGPKHTIQMDLFNFKYEQEQPDFKSPPPPHGIVGLDVFAKQVHVVPVSSKRADEWERAINEIVRKLGRPKI